MGKWVARCNINQYLLDDELDDRSKVAKIIAALEKSPQLADCEFVEDLRYTLEIEDDLLFEAEVNMILSALYNYADEERIWMGL